MYYDNRMVDGDFMYQIKEHEYCHDWFNAVFHTIYDESVDQGMLIDILNDLRDDKNGCT